jgi:hypothetical protein
LTGIWLGLMSGDMAAMVMSVIALGFCNWKRESIKAFKELQDAGEVFDRQRPRDSTFRPPLAECC